MRIILSKKNLQKLFHPVDTKKLASLCGVSERTVRTWKNGTGTIPEEAFKKIIIFGGHDIKKIPHKKRDNFWYVSRAAHLGAQARNKLYGNPGTAEGRKKGGLQSIETHNKNNSHFQTLKNITSPSASIELAEFFGIIAGDGHLSDYQVTMVTNSETDRKHARFVSMLGEKLFSIKSTIVKRKNCKAVIVTFNSKRMVDILEGYGLKKYNKIKNGAIIPQWICENQDYSKACIRGLFDTDGCVFLDTHRIGGKEYKYLGWTITSYNGNFISGIINILKNLGFQPTNSTQQKSVYLRRQTDVYSYFREIGSHNSKHLDRFKKFGRVPKRS